MSMVIVEAGESRWRLGIAIGPAAKKIGRAQIASQRIVGGGVSAV